MAWIGSFSHVLLQPRLCSELCIFDVVDLLYICFSFLIVYAFPFPCVFPLAPSLSALYICIFNFVCLLYMFLFSHCICVSFSLCLSLWRCPYIIFFLLLVSLVSLVSLFFSFPFPLPFLCFCLLSSFLFFPFPFPLLFPFPFPSPFPFPFSLFFSFSFFLFFIFFLYNGVQDTCGLARLLFRCGWNGKGTLGALIK